MTPTPTVQLERDLAALKTRVMISRADLPDLVAMQARVAYQTTQTLIDDTNRPALLEAASDLTEARAAHARHAVLARELDTLQVTLSESQHQARMDRIRDANASLSKAIERYDHASREACRAYRDLLTVQANSHRTPGAATAIPDGPTFPHLVPPGWQGSTGEHIRTNSLAWLNAEKATS